MSLSDDQPCTHTCTLLNISSQDHTQRHFILPLYGSIYVCLWRFWIGDIDSCSRHLYQHNNLLLLGAAETNWTPKGRNRNPKSRCKAEHLGARLHHRGVDHWAGKDGRDNQAFKTEGRWVDCPSMRIRCADWLARTGEQPRSAWK